MEKVLEELLRKSGAFHEDWYVAMYPNVRRSRRSPLDHFLEEGMSEGASPHPLFDAAWYLETYTDVADSGMPPIYHYLNSGGREWRAPGPFVDMDRYYETYREDVERTATGSILEDFVRSGDRSSALQFFDQAHYSEQVGDSTMSFNRCLEHFFAKGLGAGHTPHPLINLELDKQTDTKSPYIAFRKFFQITDDSGGHPLIDPGYFRSQVGDVQGSPIVHYLRTWRYSDAWLHPLLDLKAWKREALKRKGNVDPLSLFIKEGLPNGAQYNAYFDNDFYTRNFGHLFKDGETALEHYMEHGHAVWFQPSESFGQRFYVRNNAQHLRHRWPALADYLHRGSREGASPLPPRPFFDLTKGLSGEGIAEAIRALAKVADTEPRVAVIIPAYKNIEYTLRCIWSVLHSRDETPVHVLVADDQSPDGSGEELARLLDGIPGVEVVVNSENLGFLRSCNAAAEQCDAEFLFFLNNDTVVLDGWIDELVETFERNPTAGLVGSKLIYPNGLLQEAGGVIWDKGAAANYGRFDDPAAPEYNFQRDVDYISGAAILIPRDLWNDLGGFSDELAPAYYEDTDFAMKVRASGRRVIYQPASCVVHFEGISSGTDLTTGIKRFQTINGEKFAQKWATELAALGEKGDLSRATIDRAAKGRILVIDAEIPRPDRDSGSVTAFFMLKILAELGYRVTFMPANLAFEGKYVAPLRRLGVEVLHAPYISDPEAFLSENGHEYDLFIVSRAPIGERYFDWLKSRFPGTPIVFDTVDLHHLRMLREAELESDNEKLADAYGMRERELAMIRSADATILVSEFETTYVRDEVGPFSHVHLPLIYAPFERTVGFEERSGVAFVGGFRHPPNVDAVNFLCKEVWPLVRASELDIDLQIIGSAMPSSFDELAADDIHMVGFVEDLESHLSSVRVTVAPLRYGAGVKGKVGNSLRMGVPVVGTPMATEGMGLKNGEHVLTAPNASGIAREIIRLYEQKDLWETLSTEGQGFVLDAFGIEAARRKLEALCRVLISAD